MTYSLLDPNAALPAWLGGPAPATQAPQMSYQPMTGLDTSSFDWGNNASVLNSTFGQNNMAGNNIGTGQGWMGKAGNWLSDGNNLGTVVQGIGALTNAYLGFRQLSMAKDQLNFQKSSWAKNFANSVSTYNTSLEDRIRGRTSDYTGKENDVQSYLAKHKLKG